MTTRKYSKENYVPGVILTCFSKTSIIQFDATIIKNDERTEEDLDTFTINIEVFSGERGGNKTFRIDGTPSVNIQLSVFELNSLAGFLTGALDTFCVCRPGKQIEMEHQTDPNNEGGYKLFIKCGMHKLPIGYGHIVSLTALVLSRIYKNHAPDRFRENDSSFLPPEYVMASITNFQRKPGTAMLDYETAARKQPRLRTT